MIKHSIVMICYNQQEYIKKALDSILDEPIKPYEIIIGDDCSSDGTRDILVEYQRAYPEIIKLHLNEKNLGIFGNLNLVCQNVTGDMIHFLAGDDWFKPGFLASINQAVEIKGLKPDVSAFILLPAVVFYFPDGTESRICNSHRDLDRFSPVGLVLRDMLKWRLVGISRALFNHWPKFEHDANTIGPWADRVHHMLLAQHIDAQYLMGSDGAVYRVGVGVASKAGNRFLKVSYLRALLRIKEHWISQTLVLPPRDHRYLEFLIACYKARVSPGFGRYSQYLFNAILVSIFSIADIRLVLKEFYTDLRDALRINKT